MENNNEKTTNTLETSYSTNNMIEYITTDNIEYIGMI